MRCVAILADKTKRISRNLASSPCHTLFPVPQPKHRILEIENWHAQYSPDISRSTDGTENYRSVQSSVKWLCATLCQQETKICYNHTQLVSDMLDFHSQTKDVQISQSKSHQGWITGAVWNKMRLLKSFIHRIALHFTLTQEPGRTLLGNALTAMLRVQIPVQLHIVQC